jgi:hypothetical protein
VASQGYITQSAELTFHWDGVDDSCVMIGVVGWADDTERDTTQINAHHTAEGDNQCSNSRSPSTTPSTSPGRRRSRSGLSRADRAGEPPTCPSTSASLER